MLRSLKDLEGYAVSATDGDIGKVANFLLDDERWAIRYLVVHAGGFFSERHVLITPISFRQIDWATRRFHLALTRDKVKLSPSVDTDRPVFRQHESALFGYYGYPYYWGNPGLWGAASSPGLLAAEKIYEAPTAPEALSGDSHLRSAREIRGYQIRATDASAGQIEDFLIDDETWEIRYLVVDTASWWKGKKVLVAPRWTRSISWADGIVLLDLSQEAIKKSPEWNPNARINQEYEARLYDYYGQPVYWNENDRLPKPAPMPRDLEPPP
jgi:sporulation protein YlmC with PRC-barrel domain